MGNVIKEKDLNEWIVHGSLQQLGKTCYRTPIEVVVQTEQGQESRVIWLDSMKTDFKFSISERPEKLIVDPNYHIPMIRWMPPRLQNLWDSYPNFTVIYGTLTEAEANKAAAERFVDEFTELEHEIIKADTDVIKQDLRNERVILFGRPETNKISQRFQDSFPIKFENNKFTWQGTTFDLPTQGVAQIVENPLDTQSMIILYAGLSGKATQNICDKSEWMKELDGWFLIDLNTSYIIYDEHKKLVSGDWEDVNRELVWNFERN